MMTCRPAQYSTHHATLRGCTQLLEEVRLGAPNQGVILFDLRSVAHSPAKVAVVREAFAHMTPAESGASAEAAPNYISPSARPMISFMISLVPP